MSAHASEGSETDDSIDGNVQSQLPRGKRSKVWQYFENDLVSVDGDLKAVCKYCGLKLHTRSGTSSLRSHIAESCKEIDEDVRKQFISTMKKQPTDGVFVFDPDISRERMVDFVIHAEIPFKKFEDPYLQPWIDSLQPAFQVKGRQTIRNDCFEKYTGMSSLTDWGIKDKLFTVTVDNASNNTTACEELVKNNKSQLLCEGEHLHVRCAAHILNILVQDGVRIIHGSIEKIRELLKHIDSSPSRLQTFNSLAHANGLAPKRGIYIDIPNRWNATFRMIAEVLDYRAVLNSYAKQHMEDCPNDVEWDRAESICLFLKAFAELTITVSAHRKPTAHKYLSVVLFIRHALRDPDWQKGSLVLRDVAAAMEVKLDKYWDPYEDFLSPRKKSTDIEFNMALVIATVLDPRKNDVFLEFFYEKVANHLDQVPTLVARALRCMRKYFDEYRQNLRANAARVAQHSSEDNADVSSPLVGKRKLEEEFAQHKSRRRYVQAQKSEIDIYLEDVIEDDNDEFDILIWWKRHADKFPILSAMARDFLAIPLSTVASESAFSTSGRILGDSRSSLAPVMLQALVCGKDWLHKEKGEGQP